MKNQMKNSSNIYWVFGPRIATWNFVSHDNITNFPDIIIGLNTDSKNTIDKFCWFDTDEGLHY